MNTFLKAKVLALLFTFGVASPALVFANGTCAVDVITKEVLLQALEAGQTLKDIVSKYGMEAVSSLLQDSDVKQVITRIMLEGSRVPFKAVPYEEIGIACSNFVASAWNVGCDILADIAKSKVATIVIGSVVVYKTLKFTGIWNWAKKRLA
ncbi:hypothetical protein KC460_00800 [Candidatus Dependentiae bacterium]|nr:hypothetical protein [Candidatus Dependentiae bacterium]